LQKAKAVSNCRWPCHRQWKKNVAGPAPKKKKSTISSILPRHGRKTAQQLAQSALAAARSLPPAETVSPQEKTRTGAAECAPVASRAVYAGNVF
jgi:hypothetical protein